MFRYTWKLKIETRKTARDFSGQSFIVIKIIIIINIITITNFWQLRNLQISLILAINDEYCMC